MKTENNVTIEKIWLNTGDSWKQKIFEKILRDHPSVSPDVVFEIIEGLNSNEPAASKEFTADVIAGIKNQDALSHLGNEYNSEIHAVANGDVVARVIDDEGTTHFFDKVKNETELEDRLALLKDLLVLSDEKPLDTMLLSWQVSLVVQNGLTYVYDQEIFAHLPKLTEVQFNNLVKRADEMGLLYGANTTLPLIEWVIEQAQARMDAEIFVTSSFMHRALEFTQLSEVEATNLQNSIIGNTPSGLTHENMDFSQLAA